MSACKEKQNLRYKKVCERINKKVRYDGFSKDEISLIKAIKEYQRIDAELNKFYRTALRDKDNKVDWNNIDEVSLNIFDHIYNLSQKLLKRISKLEDKGIDRDKVMYNLS